MTLKFRTAGYGGQTLNKTVKIYTSDPDRGVMEIDVTGKVNRFATITPKAFLMTGVVGEKLSQKVTIVPETPVPFTLKKVTALEGTDIAFSVKDTEISGKKAYEINVENIRTTEGKYTDKIIIITSENNHEPLSILVRGIIKSEAESQAEGSKEAAPRDLPGMEKTGE